VKINQKVSSKYLNHTNKYNLIDENILKKCKELNSKIDDIIEKLQIRLESSI